MRYLFILSELPFPAHRNGVALINYQIITRAGSDVDIDLIVSDSLDLALEDEFRKVAPRLGKVTYVGLATARRYRIGNLISGALLGRCLFENNKAVVCMREDRSDYDAVYIAPLMSYVDPGRIPKTFMNAVDSFARLNYNSYRNTKKMSDGLKSWLYTHYEKKVLKRVICTSFVSPVDADFVAQRSSGLMLVATPNGVDTDFFTPSENPREPHSILFTGNFSYIPNAQAALFFAQEVLPIIQRNHVDARFYVVGPHAPKALSAIPGVIVTGFVVDIRDYYQRCSIFVCPLLSGAGIKNKVLEAMSSGIPIVTTRLGMDGIDGTSAGEHYYAADTATEFAVRVAHIWSNPDEAREVSTKARGIVCSRMTWSAVTDQYYSHLRAVGDRSRLFAKHPVDASV